MYKNFHVQNRLDFLLNASTDNHNTLGIFKKRNCWSLQGQNSAEIKHIVEMRGKTIAVFAVQI